MTAREHVAVEAREAVDELVEEERRHDSGVNAINALDHLREYIADVISLLQAEAAARQARARIEQWKGGAVSVEQWKEAL